MDKYLLFEDFENGKYIKKKRSTESNQLYLRSFNFLVNFECQYNYATKLKIVCR